MKASLRSRLAILWLGYVTLCAALAWLAVDLYRQGAGSQIAAARRAATAACTAIRAQVLAQGSDTPPSPELLFALLSLALREYPGVEGGLWIPQRGFVGYAYPTYEGSSPKRDVPEAEKPGIEALARASLEAGAPRLALMRGAREAMILAACPLADREAAWTLTRVPAALASQLQRLSYGLASVFAAVLASGLWLGLTLRRLSAQLESLKTQLETEPHKPLEPTGAAELDRIAAAFERARRRLAAARAETERLAAELARKERLAALGRLAAGIAHELRNPLATLRLRAENALAAGASSAPLKPMLEQIARLERIVQDMLAMAAPLKLAPQRVALAPWLRECAAAVAAAATDKGIRLEVWCEESARAVFDPVHLARAVENLLWNAVRHAPPDSAVELAASTGADGQLVLRVADQGPGVAPELRAQLFEPFASGEPGGVGLGLALAREIFLAHGGELRYLERARGAAFEGVLPWRTS
jgi:signal transduction histidine kinase